MTGIDSLNGLKIRLATRDEWPALRAVQIDADKRYESLGVAPTTLDETIPQGVAYTAIEDERLFVAELDATIVGWVYAGRIGAEPSIGHVCVASHVGRKKIGHALVERALERCRSTNAPSVVLMTFANVPWTIPWYERLGFRLVEAANWSPEMVQIFESHQIENTGPLEPVFMRMAFNSPVQ